MGTAKKIGVAILVAGACGLALLMIAAEPRFQRTTPPAAKQVSPWNPRAIEGTLAAVRVQEIDPTHAAVVFVYDLDNTTDTDYRLVKGPNLVIMSRLKSSGALSGDEQVVLDSTAFVPARNRTRIALEVNHPFNWPGQRSSYAERTFDQLVTGDVAGVAGFVLFDQTSRYEIDFPAAWPDIRALSSAP
jgi:hypothetical protein